MPASRIIRPTRIYSPRASAPAFLGLPIARSYTLTAPNPTGGPIGSPSGNWTAQIPNGFTLPNAVHVTLAISGGGSGTTITLQGNNASGTGTVTPTGSPSNRTVSTTNDGGLTDPAGVQYAAVAATGGGGPTGISMARLIGGI